MNRPIAGLNKFGLLNKKNTKTTKFKQDQYRRSVIVSRSAQKQISLSQNITHPNQYVRSLYNEYRDWAFDEVSALEFKGKWREVFSKNYKGPLHLEIGPGNGRHFSKLCLNNPADCFLSIELKYKPLIQTIRRVRKNNSSNGKVIRYNASLIEALFEKQELNNVYIHFPDPWLKKRRSKKHQLIQEKFCKKIYNLQQASSILEFKTDSEDYFHQSIECFEDAGYRLSECSLNLYENTQQEKGFMENLSQFELLFFQKKIPIKYAVFIRP